MSNLIRPPMFVAAALALAAPAPAALAQTGAAPNPQAGSAVGEVVVTAERREENIQKVPIAITALTGQAIEQQNIVGFEDLSEKIPSLRFGSGVTGGEDVITMRGLGSQNTTPGGDSPVSYNVNGVYIQQTTSVDPEFYDIQRIEVLGGPQGTLYGRNSVGGSINVITNKPTDVFAASADVLAGNYGAAIVRSFVNGPLYDGNGVTIDGRLTGVYAEHGPYTTNLSTDPAATHNQDAENYWMLRGQLNIQLGPNVNLLLYASYSNAANPVANNVQYWESPVRYLRPPGGIAANSPCNFSTEGSVNPRVICNNSPDDGDDSVGLYSATLTWDLPWAQLTSITSYSHASSWSVNDGDGSPLPMGTESWFMVSTQASQEFHLTSRDAASPLQWLAGFIYFWDEDREPDYEDVDDGYNDIFPLPGVTDEFTFKSHGYTDTSSWAPFGQASYDFAKTRWNVPLTLTLGLRYTNDTKYGYSYLNYALPAIAFDSITQEPFSRTWGELTGKLEANYQITSNIMGYVSGSRGYLAGGDIIGLAHIYAPETLWSYEGGVKSQFFDNRLTLNASVYHEEIEHLQVFVQSSVESGINNVNGTTDVDGLETQATWMPIDNLHLNTAVTLTDGQYGNYYTTDTRFGYPGPDCNAVSSICNFKGHWLNQTPPYTVAFGIDYVFHTPVGRITPRLDTFFSGKVQFLPDNYYTSTQPDYHMTDLSLIWNSLDNRYEIQAFVKNLENANVISNDSLQSISYAEGRLEPDNFTYYPPRTFGVRITARIGG